MATRTSARLFSAKGTHPDRVGQGRDGFRLGPASGGGGYRALRGAKSIMCGVRGALHPVPDQAANCLTASPSYSGAW